MRIINNAGINGDLLIDMYWHRLGPIVAKQQLSLISFNEDCIKVFGMNDELIVEFGYFNETVLLERFS